MNTTNQTTLTAEAQAVPPLPVDYDAEAASQPTLPPRLNDTGIVHMGKEDSPKDPASEKPNSRSTLLFVLFVLFAMAATGFAVWFVMDSKIQNETQQPGGSSAVTLAPDPSPSNGPMLEISDSVLPLSICMGDCDEDSDCGPGLRCFQRNGNTPVPGCSGGLEDSSETDYCIPIEQPSLAIVQSYPLGLCEGDCDSDEDCGHGLFCYQRFEYEYVPGCSGGSDDGSRTDYCTLRNLVPETYMMSLGNKIIGNPDDNFGSAVSLSQSDPLLMAVGAVDRGSTGYVNIYKLEKDRNGLASDEWILAASIEGDEVGSEFGRSVSMSWDGYYVAIGIPNGKDGRKIKVFKSLITDQQEYGWNQVGNDIAVEDSEENDNGFAVSLSEDGSILVVTEDYRFSTYERADSEEWVLQASKGLDGYIEQDSISLSGDGTRVAISVKPYDPQAGSGRAYEFNGNEWIRVGQTLGDVSIFYSFGMADPALTSTSLSGDGTTLVTSRTDREGGLNYVQAYQDMGDSEWTPKGDPILGKLDKFAPASKVEISKDGTVVAIGDYDLGRVRLYEFDSRLDQWIIVGEVDAENENDQLGVALSLAGGKGEAYLAIGGPNKKHVIGNPGFAITYKTTFGIRPDPTPSPSTAPTEWTGESVIDRAQYFWSGEISDDTNDVAGNSVAVSGDGKVFAYGLSSDIALNRIVVYDEGGRDQRPQLSGTQSDDEFGYSISLSDDGLTMAVGTPNSKVGTVQGAGSVKVYSYDPIGKAWTQMGGDIVGSFDEESGRFGHSVSLNGNGDIVAIGAPSASTASMYRFQNNAWIKIGDDIFVSYSKAAWHGWSISLSTNGLVVAVGGPTNEDNWDEAGACRIYEFANNSWQQRGQPILGEQRHGLLGTSVSLSGDGSTVAIGAINYELPEAFVNKEEGMYQYGENAGAVFVYEYSEEGTWKSLGKPIIGIDAFDRFGWSVSLSKDGTKLAAGAPEHGEGGQVRLFVFDEDHLYWNQISDIQRYDGSEDEGKNGGFGTSVALVDSADGWRMIVGAPRTRARYGERLGLLPKYAGEVSIFEEQNK